MSSPAPKVAIILLNWNGFEDTRACAESLAAQRYQPAQVYLVDNASTDNSVARLGVAFPRFTHIANERNEGFAVANNQIMEKALAAGADYVLLLNNDTVVAPNFLLKMVGAAEADEQVGMVVPKIYFYDRPDEIWYAGSRINYETWPPLKHIGEGEKDVGQYDVPSEPDFVTGCCVLVRARLIRETGMLDPTYGFYCEDVDWSLRARAAGWRLHYEPRARVWHRVNRSMGRAGIDPIYYSYRNVAVLARRHLPWQRAAAVVWLVVRSALGNARYAEPSRGALVEAACDAILGQTGIVEHPGSSPLARALTGTTRFLFRFGRMITKPFRISAHLYRKFRERDARRARRAAKLKAEA